jgi:hypothetical protein
MKSPFPGMDPYLEQHWQDIHASLVVCARDQLQPFLPDGLLARVEEHVHIVSETFIAIREAGSRNRVITLIDFLSPANKMPGAGRDLYRRKQEERCKSGVNLVEVDLVRSTAPPYESSADMGTPYHIVVRRRGDPPKIEIFPMTLRERLKGIRVPLRQTDPETTLNLQLIVDLCYRNGRYDTMNYQVDPDPPLTGADAAWADALLRAAGKRT